MKGRKGLNSFLETTEKKLQGGSMSENLFHAMLWISSWGDDRVLINKLKDRPEVYSIFHIMGSASYLLDVFVSSKRDMRNLIFEMKRYNLPQAPIPMVSSLATQKVLHVYKYQKDFNIAYYSEERIYAFTTLFVRQADEDFVVFNISLQYGV